MEYISRWFFFKQKTAYDMRISDWSSDVCSSDLEQFLDFGDRHAARCRHHRIEIARGLAVDEIALVVAAPRLDDGEIGGQPRLENIALAAEDFFLFAFGDDRAEDRKSTRLNSSH